MSKNTDVIFVGGGVIGCSIAYQLAKQGMSATVLAAAAVRSRRFMGQYSQLGCQQGFGTVAEAAIDAPVLSLRAIPRVYSGG